MQQHSKSHRSQRGVACAVADLAGQAAETARALDAMRAAPKLAAQLERREEHPHPAQLRDAWRRRLRALESMAVEQQAASTKGALFQLMLAAARVQEGVHDAAAELSTTAAAQLRATEAAATSLSYSALTTLVSQQGDGDLDTLLEHYLPRAWDVQMACRTAAAGVKRSR